MVALLCASFVQGADKLSSLPTGGGNEAGVVSDKKTVLLEAPIDSLVGHDNGTVRIYNFAINLPGTNDPTFASLATAAVNAIYDSNNVPGALGFRLDPNDITQPTSANDTSVWYAVHVIVDDPTFQFHPNMLRFIGSSSDTGNALGKTNSFTDPTLIFSPWAMGVDHGTGGARFNDTKYTSGAWKVVKEFIFIGSRSKYFIYGNEAGQASLLAAIAAVPHFSTTGRWEVWKDGNRINYSSKTLYLQDGPVQALLSIGKFPSTSVTVGITAGTNDTWTLQHSLLMPATWTDKATLNSGDSYEKVATDQGYWNLVLQ